MEIHFQTTDHVVAVEKVAEQHIRTKYCKCNSFRVISHIIILAKIAITHSKVGQSSPNPKNIEEQKKFIRTCDLPKMCNCSSFRENCVTHARTHPRMHPRTHVHTHMVQIIISLRRAGREIITLNVIVFKLQLIYSTVRTSKELLLSYAMSYMSEILLCYS